MSDMDRAMRMPPLPAGLSAEQVAAVRREQAARVQQDAREPAAQQRGSAPRELRSRVREQDRELAFLRRRVAELEAGGAPAEPEEPAVPDGAEQPPAADADAAEPAGEPVTAEQVAAERAARQAAEIEAGLLRAGITPEVRRAAELVDQAQAGAIPPVNGLEGMLTRLNDRSVSWPQLQQELQSMGWRDPAEVGSWDGPAR